MIELVYYLFWQWAILYLVRPQFKSIKSQKYQNNVKKRDDVIRSTTDMNSMASSFKSNLVSSGRFSA